VTRPGPGSSFAIAALAALLLGIGWLPATTPAEAVSPNKPPRDIQGSASPTAPVNPASGALKIDLNAHWRVISEDIQWVLQKRDGKATAKSSGWKGRSFCTKRTTLLRDISEKCGEVDTAALALVKALPEYHPGWLAHIQTALRESG